MKILIHIENVIIDVENVQDMVVINVVNVQMDSISFSLNQDIVLLKKKNVLIVI